MYIYEDAARSVRQNFKVQWRFRREDMNFDFLGLIGCLINYNN